MNMGTLRWDETWHRLREWTNGQAQSERLAAQVLKSAGFTEIEPSHPLGGRDGGKDAVCTKYGKRWVIAVYFPRGQKEFAEIEAKFLGDLQAAKQNTADGFAFVTNQELTLSQRKTLRDNWRDRIELYHLETITAILDSPSMHAIRKQFLAIDHAESSHTGKGGDGGGGAIIGDRGTVIAGKGGSGGLYGLGGAGGSGYIKGDDGLIVGGDGGSCPTADGRGGRGGVGPSERMVGPTNRWGLGRGGAGKNHPEYDRRLGILVSIRQEYAGMFPERVVYLSAGIDRVPITWVNKRLEEMGEKWRVRMGEEGYILPDLPEDLLSGR